VLSGHPHPRNRTPRPPSPYSFDVNLSTPAGTLGLWGQFPKRTGDGQYFGWCTPPKRRPGWVTTRQGGPWERGASVLRCGGLGDTVYVVASGCTEGRRGTGRGGAEGRGALQEAGIRWVGRCRSLPSGKGPADLSAPELAYELDTFLAPARFAPRCSGDLQGLPAPSPTFLILRPSSDGLLLAGHSLPSSCAIWHASGRNETHEALAHPSLPGSTTQPGPGRAPARAVGAPRPVEPLPRSGVVPPHRQPGVAGRRRPIKDPTIME
jgi:hypothetical protein